MLSQDPNKRKAQNRAAYVVFFFFFLQSVQLCDLRLTLNMMVDNEPFANEKNVMFGI